MLPTLKNLFIFFLGNFLRQTWQSQNITFHFLLDWNWCTASLIYFLRCRFTKCWQHWPKFFDWKTQGFGIFPSNFEAENQSCSKFFYLGRFYWQEISDASHNSKKENPSSRFLHLQVAGGGNLSIIKFSLSPSNWMIEIFQINQLTKHYKKAYLGPYFFHNFSK